VDALQEKSLTLEMQKTGHKKKLFYVIVIVEQYIIKYRCPSESHGFCIGSSGKIGRITHRENPDQMKPLGTYLPGQAVPGCCPNKESLKVIPTVFGRKTWKRTLSKIGPTCKFCLIAAQFINASTKTEKERYTRDAVRAVCGQFDFKSDPPAQPSDPSRFFD